MLRILICDDDSLFLKNLHTKILEYLSEIGIKAKIYCYESREEISLALLSRCDIAFLDIAFSQETYTGIDIAKEFLYTSA